MRRSVAWSGQKPAAEEMKSGAIPELQDSVRGGRLRTSFPLSSRSLMRLKCVRNSLSGMTLIEIACATAVLSMVVSVTLVRGNLKAKADRVHCIANLKENGLAFRQFANDNADFFPTQVPESLGGARDAANDGNVENVFQVLADYSLKPDELVCPSDSRRPGIDVEDVSASHLSYFVNTEARRYAAKSPLMGDRNLIVGGGDGGREELISGTFRLGAEQRDLEWSSAMHCERGNIALADGSVQQVKTPQLPGILSPPDAMAARFLFPQ